MKEVGIQCLESGSSETRSFHSGQDGGQVSRFGFAIFKFFCGSLVQSIDSTLKVIAAQAVENGPRASEEEVSIGKFTVEGGGGVSHICKRPP